VQYAFLELPKLPPERPATGAGYWAWLFVHAPELKEVPADLPPGPHREALALANEASFTAGELEAYRRVMDEIQQAREYGDEREARGRAEGEARGRAEGEARGKVEGLREGEAKGLRAAVVDLCEVLGLALSDGQRAQLAALSVAELEALRQQLKRERRWPD
jgi:flagellar biosynthesis/type III secretory pathway protein FliH